MSDAEHMPSSHDMAAAAAAGGQPVSRRQFTAGGFAGAALAVAGRATGQDAVTVPADRRATGPLADYAHAADAATRFDPVDAGEFAGGSWRTLRLVSQRWRGVEWIHELSMYRPAGAVGPTMLLGIDGGKSAKVPEQGPLPITDTIRLLATVANAAHMPAAIIRQVPCQPMFDGLVEDGLIAHSFEQFVRTGDLTWPLLLPMVKAAVEGMNAASQVARAEWGIEADRFVVTGASKRGWTTWLTAAVDPRVVAAVPMVIDMLSMERQLRLQVESFGKLSEQLDDYTSRGIEKLVATPRGRELVEIVDPYSYRDTLTLPKLIALGTNDPYWPLEALEVYRSGLRGPCWVSYSPNSGHGLPPERIAGWLAAMARHAAGERPLPTIGWRFEPHAAGAACVLESDEPPAEVLLWRAESATRDFRQSRWTSTPLPVAGRERTAVIQRPTTGLAAALVQCRYDRTPWPLLLTSGVHVVGTTA